jgi:hypothetical protein
VTFIVAQECFDQTVHVTANSTGTPVRLHCTPSNDPGEFRITATPRNGHLEDRDMQLGNVSYVPLPDFTGTDTLKFVSINHHYPSSAATVTFVIGSGSHTTRKRPAQSSVTAASTAFPRIWPWSAPSRVAVLGLITTVR